MGAGWTILHPEGGQTWVLGVKHGHYLLDVRGFVVVGGGRPEGGNGLIVRRGACAQVQGLWLGGFGRKVCGHKHF